MNWKMLKNWINMLAALKESVNEDMDDYID